MPPAATQRRSLVSTGDIGPRELARNLKNLYKRYTSERGLEEGEGEFQAQFSALRKKMGGNRRLGGYDKFSLRALAEGIFGTDSPYELDRRFRLGGRMIQKGMYEAVTAVDLSAFSNITGQLLVDRIRDNYEAPQFITDELFENIPVTGGNLGPHIEPWLSRVKDDPGVLQPQQVYPETNFIEQYITLAAVNKRGLKVSVTLELIFGDKTKQVMQRCDDTGFRLRFNKEERGFGIITGMANAAGFNNFTYMGTNYNTYQTTGLWVNTLPSNTITDYKGVAGIEVLFSNMKDFVTGKAIVIDPAEIKILCVPAKIPELKIALHAARTRSGPYGASGATNTQQEMDDVPLINDVDYPILKSQILYNILLSTDPTTAASIGGLSLSAAQAKEYVYAGNFKKAFYYREAMPFMTEQAPVGSPPEFEQDIMVQVRAREWGVHGVQAPQQVVWSYNN